MELKAHYGTSPMPCADIPPCNAMHYQYTGINIFTKDGVEISVEEYAVLAETAYSEWKANNNPDVVIQLQPEASDG